MALVNGLMIQEETTEIATKLKMPGFADFKASNGWLGSWKDRYRIKQRAVEGKSGQVRPETVKSWMEWVRKLCKGYKPEDIWNQDETGCFFRASPRKASQRKEANARVANNQNIE